MADPYVQAGLSAGLSPALAGYMPRYVHIESGGNPNARTGSYTGVLQMGPDEIKKYGGNDINAGAKMYADKAQWFSQKYGRDPTPTELYMVNQQGQGGLAAHMANPSGAAWRNMAGTAEGQQKGDAWAKQAIWGNVPDDLKGNYPGGVDSMTSQQFMDMWRNKVEQGQPFNPVAAQQPQAPAWSPLAASGAPSPAPQGGPDNGLLGSAMASMGLPQPQQGQSLGAYAGDALRGAFGMPPAQPGAQQQNSGGGYMPQMPAPQQLQAPNIQYYRPQQMAGMQMPQLGPLRF